AMVVHAKGIGPHFTFFVVYGRSPVVLDLDEVVVQEREFPLLTAKEVNLEVRSRLKRRMIVVGATVGTDAHTVGLDAILNVKGITPREVASYLVHALNGRLALPARSGR